MASSGLDTLRKLPRVIRSLMMRDLLRLLSIDNLKGWERAVSGLRNGLTQLPSGRYLVHSFERSAKDRFVSSWSQERDTVEALIELATKKGWVKVLSNENGLCSYDIAQDGRKILDGWDKHRSCLLAGMIAERNFNAGS